MSADNRTDTEVISEALKIARDVIIENWPEGGPDETYLAQARLESIDAAQRRLGQ